MRATWADPAGRQFSILSGIEGEIGSLDVLAPIDVRGHVATVSRNSDTQTYFAIWRESPEGSPCGQYAAIGTGWSEEAFRSYVGRIR